MSRNQRRRWLAWSALLLAGIGTVFTFVESPTLESTLFGGMFIAFPVVGMVLEMRAPENGIGRLLLVVGALAGVGGMAAGATFLAPADTLVAATGRWLQYWLFYPTIGLILPLLLVFPTGRVLSSRWRWALWASPAFVALASVGAAFYPWPPEEGGPNPLAVEELASFWLFLLDVAGIPILVGAVAGVASLVVRYRRAEEIERHQIKWFLTAATLFPIAIAVGDEFRQLQGVIVPIAFILFPVAIGVAITRYRLYEIDRIISRTVTYAIITALLVGAYVTVVFVLRVLLPGDSQLAVVASTLAAAALFAPLRRRVQGVVDRRFNRSRYDAARVVASFGVRVRTQERLEGVADDLIRVAGHTMQPDSASLWLREPTR